MFRTLLTVAAIMVCSPSVAADLTGKTLETEFSIAYVLKANKSIAGTMDGQGFYIYFAKDGTRFFYTGDNEGVQIGPGDTRGQFVDDDGITAIVEIRSEGSKISVRRVTEFSPGSTSTYLVQIDVPNSTSCKLSSVKYSSSENTMTFKGIPVHCKLTEGNARAGR